FMSGSQFWIYRSSNPFQLAAPAAAVVFDHGSLFRALSNNTPVFTSRTYGNFEFKVVTNAFSPFHTVNITVGGDCNMDTMRLTQAGDTLNLNGNTAGTLFLKGNIENQGIINIASGTKPVVFAGGIEQK